MKWKWSLIHTSGSVHNMTMAFPFLFYLESFHEDLGRSRCHMGASGKMIPVNAMVIPLVTRTSVQSLFCVQYLHDTFIQWHWEQSFTWSINIERPCMSDRTAQRQWSRGIKWNYLTQSFRPRSWSWVQLGQKNWKWRFGLGAFRVSKKLKKFRANKKIQAHQDFPLVLTHHSP